MVRSGRSVDGFGGRVRSGWSGIFFHHSNSRKINTATTKKSPTQQQQQKNQQKPTKKKKYLLEPPTTTDLARSHQIRWGLTYSWPPYVLLPETEGGREREPLRVRTEEGEIGRAWDRKTEQREGERKKERERRWEQLRKVNWGFFLIGI